MKLNAYENFSTFKKRFHEYCVECEMDDLEYPMYRGFIALLKQLSDEENDKQKKVELTAEYTKTLRHWCRAKWVQERFFRDYGQMLVGPVDLFLWGCGSGLDLLAFYDQALQCEKPQIWTVVRSVTLIGGSKERVNRAVEIAEVLFPMASGRIVGQVCDFENALDVACLSEIIAKQSSHGFVPRIHIMSGSVMSVSHVGDFAQQIKTLLVRQTEKGGESFNDIFCASEPGSDRLVLYGKMREFEEIWKGEVGLGSPTEIAQFSAGTYYAFHCMTFENHRIQVALRSDNPVMQGLFQIMLGENEDRSWLHMMNDLSKLPVKLGSEEKYFCEVYRHVKEVDLKSGSRKEDANVHCLMFAADDGVEAKVFLLKLAACTARGDNPYEEKNLAKSWLIRFSRDSSNDDISQLAKKLKHIEKGQNVREEYRKLFGYVRLMAWDPNQRKLQEFPGGFKDTFYTQQPADFLAMFGQAQKTISAEVLPESLNRAQREIVFGRKRQRLVRGGPGTGKHLRCYIMRWRCTSGRIYLCCL